MDVDVADPSAPLADQELERWRRMLPPCVVTVAGRAEPPAGCTSSTATRPGSRSSSRTAPGGARPARPLGGAAGGRRDRLIGEATFAIPDGPAPRLPHPARGLVDAHDHRGPDRDARLARAPAPPPRAGPGASPPSSTASAPGAPGVSATWPTSPTWRPGPARLGADYVLINPLHAAEPLPPLEPSPYLPSTAASSTRSTCASRTSPSTPSCPSDQPRAVDRSGAQRAAAGWTPAADRPGPGLGGQAGGAAAGPRGRRAAPSATRSFAEFRAREGDALRQFATWSVLAEDHGNDAREWPEALRDVDSQEVADLAVRHVGRVGFHMWLQWVLDEQLQAAQASAVAAGMRLGTMHDLAVGVHPGGADAWRLPARLRRGGPRRRTAGPVQPARPELEPAAVAAGPAGRGRPTRRSAS